MTAEEKTKTEEKKNEIKIIEAKEESKKEEVKKDNEKEEKKKSDKEHKAKKTEAIVNGKDLPISIKHAVAICNFIRGKDIDEAIAKLEDVTKFKKAVPMRGEIPHRKGMMSGRYPVKACGFIIKLLKSLKSNAIANELELEKYKLFCMANVASRPYRRFGTGRFKRSHVSLKLITQTFFEKESLNKEYLFRENVNQNQKKKV